MEYWGWLLAKYISKHGRLLFALGRFSILVSFSVKSYSRLRFSSLGTDLNAKAFSQLARWLPKKPFNGRKASSHLLYDVNEKMAV
jgi:hypothetical protein